MHCMNAQEDHSADGGRMTHVARVAVIEDGLPTSNQLKGWILAARPAGAMPAWR